MTDKPDFTTIPIFDRYEVPITDPPNRGYENRFETGSINPVSVKLIQIDTILENYFNNIMIPTVTDQEGESLNVPVLFSNPERWAAIKKHGIYRDERNDKLQPPMIFIRRLNIRPNSMNNPNNKYLYRTWNRSWNRRNAYDRFAALNRIRPSEELHNVIVPDYIDLNYQVIMWTPYMYQLNELVEQINVENYEYWGEKNNYKFRVSIEEFTDDSELPAVDDRIIRASFNMKVSAYLVPEKMIKNFKLSDPNSKYYTAKKLVTFLEIERTGGSDTENC